MGVASPAFNSGTASRASRDAIPGRAGPAANHCSGKPVQTPIRLNGGIVLNNHRSVQGISMGRSSNSPDRRD